MVNGRIFVRFRSVNIIIFTLVFVLMMVALSVTFNYIITQISVNFAKNIAISSAETLGEHISREIGIISSAAKSDAVIEWLLDEDDGDKKSRAFRELSGMTGALYSGNMYICSHKTLREYVIEDDYGRTGETPLITLSASNPEDAWYFLCVESEDDYILSVGFDDLVQKRRVFLDYKITHNGEPLGVIATGMDFSQITGELFTQFDNTSARGFIIDEYGNINIDSMYLSKAEQFESVNKKNIRDEIHERAFHAHLNEYLNLMRGNRALLDDPAVIKLSFSPYRYASIAPIENTNWSAILIYNSSSTLDIILFLPVFAAMLIMLLAFTLVISTVSYRMIFKPLDQLIGSIERLRENKEETLYGIERPDEIGSLSKTIFELYTKTNHDALTGIFNRRYLETHLNYINEFTSRSNGLISVFLIDVDFFKRYNDTYGHKQGDVCLQKVANALADSFKRTNDFIARYGGEEFVAVLPGTNKDGALIIAEKMLENVRQLKIPHENSDAAEFVTVSVGVTTGKASYSVNWSNYIKCADEALYMSKQSGRNKFTYLEFAEK